jgi:hypothetical protein
MKKCFSYRSKIATQSPEPGMEKRATNCSKPKAKPKACKRLPDEFSSRSMGLFIAVRAAETSREQSRVSRHQMGPQAIRTVSTTSCRLCCWGKEKLELRVNLGGRYIGLGTKMREGDSGAAVGDGECCGNDGWLLMEGTRWTISRSVYRCLNLSLFCLVFCSR